MSLIKQLLDLNTSTVTETKVLESEESFDELLDKFMDEQKMYGFEGRQGLINLCRIVSALGYKDDNYNMQLARGASVGDLINFLEDNPAVFELVLDFIKDQDSSEWAENLRGHLNGE